MSRKAPRFSYSQVYEILDRHFNKKEEWKDIAKDFLLEGEDQTIIYRICLPKGHHDARYKVERRKFFTGMVPLSKQLKK